MLSGVCRNENDVVDANSGAGESETAVDAATASSPAPSPATRRSLVTSDTLLTISYELLLPELPKKSYQKILEHLTSAAFRKRTFPRAVEEAIQKANEEELTASSETAPADNARFAKTKLVGGQVLCNSDRCEREAVTNVLDDV